MSKKTVFLVLASAIALDGEICKRGDVIEVDDQLARNLLHRGKARLATSEDGAPVDDEADDDRGLPRMNKAQLLAFAASNEIVVDDRMTRAQILQAIEAALESVDE